MHQDRDPKRPKIPNPILDALASCRLGVWLGGLTGLGGGIWILYFPPQVPPPHPASTLALMWACAAGLVCGVAFKAAGCLEMMRGLKNFGSFLELFAAGAAGISASLLLAFWLPPFIAPGS